jgi:hypothetical protein
VRLKRPGSGENNDAANRGNPIALELIEFCGNLFAMESVRDYGDEKTEARIYDFGGFRK